LTHTTRAHATPRTLKRFFTVCALVTGLFSTASSATSTEALEIAGYVEKVQIAGTDLVFEARLDSGATTSSLNALDLETFERDGKDWVRFDVVDPKDTTKRIPLEYPIKRNVRIVRHDGNHQNRPVIQLPLCIGTHERLADVSLVDRSELTYQLLVGRNHMRGSILIDSGKRFMHEPSCSSAS